VTDATSPRGAPRRKKTLTTTQAAKYCGINTVLFRIQAAGCNFLPATEKVGPSGRVRQTWYAADVKILAGQLNRDRRDRARARPAPVPC
jgi:hypothetical protein